MDEFLTPSFLDSDIGDSNNEFNDVFNVSRENSIKPWNNQSRIRMFHGTLDNAVVYKQAYNYYLDHNNQYGNIRFVPVIGEHITAFVPYQAAVSAWFLFYK